MTCFRSFLVALLMALFLITVGLPGSAFASDVDLVPLSQTGSGACAAGGGTGGEDVCVGAVSDTLAFATTMVIDAAGTNAWSIDLAWDQGLENAVNLVSVSPTTSFVRGFENPTPPPTHIGYSSLALGTVTESDATNAGRINQVTGAVTQDLTLMIANTSFRAGTATFSIGATNQTVLNFGFFRTDGAVMGNAASQFVTPTFGSWVINQAPEPGTTLLMGLGLFGLAFAARWNRR